MSKNTSALETMPPVVLKALESVGSHLSIARIRRGETQRNWAKRLGVSIPTLIRLEKGDPGVSLGIVATALWMMGRIDSFESLGSPINDLGALEKELRDASKKRRVRTTISIEARLKESPR